MAKGVSNEAAAVKPPLAKKKSRGNGEGSIWQQESGRRYWVAEVSVGYCEGKRIRKRIYGETRQEVAKKMLALQQQVADGTLIPSAGASSVPPLSADNLTVAAFLEQWLDHKAARLRPTTIRSYRQLVRVHILPAFGAMKLGDVRASDISVFVTQKLKEGTLSRRTVQYLRVILSMAFNYAVNDDLLEKNVVKKTEPVSSDDKEHVAFSMEQCRQLQAAFIGHRQETLFTVTLNLGLRFGEAIGLRWENVKINPDGSGGSIYVKEQIQRVEGVYKFQPPKTKSGIRTIPLPAFVAQSLREHEARQEVERLLAGKAWDENWGLVFPNTFGKPQGQRWVSRQFETILKKAGLPHIRFHDQRSLAISMLVAANINPRIIMKIVGHKTLHQTMVIYARVLQGEDQAAADALQKLMGGVGSKSGGMD